MYTEPLVGLSHEYRPDGLNTTSLGVSSGPPLGAGKVSGQGTRTGEGREPLVAGVQFTGQLADTASQRPPQACVCPEGDVVLEVRGFPEHLLPSSKIKN